MSINLPEKDEYQVAVISDTHRILRDEMMAHLREVDLVIHAGDIDSSQVLARLRSIAPVVAVRGNMDRDPGVHALPLTETIVVGQASIHILHDLEKLRPDWKEQGYSIIISGHTHHPLTEEREGVLFLNPGAAGEQRNTYAPSFALICISQARIQSRFVEL